jgi:hypothetical protein
MTRFDACELSRAMGSVLFVQRPIPHTKPQPISIVLCVDDDAAQDHHLSPVVLRMRDQRGEGHIVFGLMKIFAGQRRRASDEGIEQRNTVQQGSPVLRGEGTPWARVNARLDR